MAEAAWVLCKEGSLEMIMVRPQSLNIIHRTLPPCLELNDLLLELCYRPHSLQTLRAKATLRGLPLAPVRYWALSCNMFRGDAGRGPSVNALTNNTGPRCTREVNCAFRNPQWSCIRHVLHKGVLLSDHLTTKGSMNQRGQ